MYHIKKDMMKMLIPKDLLKLYTIIKGIYQSKKNQ